MDKVKNLKSGKEHILPEGGYGDSNIWEKSMIKFIDGESELILGSNVFIAIEEIKSLVGFTKRMEIGGKTNLERRQVDMPTIIRVDLLITMFDNSKKTCYLEYSKDNEDPALALAKQLEEDLSAFHLKSGLLRIDENSYIDMNEINTIKKEKDYFTLFFKDKDRITLTKEFNHLAFEEILNKWRLAKEYARTN